MTVRALRQISGEAEFNEVFFDDVRSTPDAVVGGVGNGWGTALDDADVRAASRSASAARSRLSTRPLREGDRAPIEPGAPRSGGAPAARRDRPSTCWRVRFTGYRALTASRRRPDPRPRGRAREGRRSSTARSQAGDLIADVLGPDALADDSEWAYMISVPAGHEVCRRHRGDPAQHDRRARARTAAEPRLDKGIPFSDLVEDRPHSRKRRRRHDVHAAPAARSRTTPRRHRRGASR